MGYARCCYILCYAGVVLSYFPLTYQVFFSSTWILSTALNEISCAVHWFHMWHDVHLSRAHLILVYQWLLLLLAGQFVLCWQERKFRGQQQSKSVQLVDVMHVLVEVLSMWFFCRKQKLSKFSSQLMLTQGSPSSPQVQFLSPSSNVGFGRTASRSSATQYGWSNLANGGNVTDVFYNWNIFSFLYFIGL